MSWRRRQCHFETQIRPIVANVESEWNLADKIVLKHVSQYIHERAHFLRASDCLISGRYVFTGPERLCYFVEQIFCHFCRRVLIVWDFRDAVRGRYVLGSVIVRRNCSCWNQVRTLKKERVHMIGRVMISMNYLVDTVYSRGAQIVETLFRTFRITLGTKHVLKRRYLLNH